jgi:hypothetical protein
MQRFLTVEKYNGNILVFKEEDGEIYRDAVNKEDTANWVWQFANSVEQARKQHIQKMDDFEADGTKDTY